MDEPLKIVFEGQMDDVEVHDGGHALIWQIDNDAVDPHLFVRVQSWDEGGASTEAELTGHPTFQELMGKRIRITIETLDD